MNSFFEYSILNFESALHTLRFLPQGGAFSSEAISLFFLVKPEPIGEPCSALDRRSMTSSLFKIEESVQHPPVTVICYEKRG